MKREAFHKLVRRYAQLAQDRPDAFRRQVFAMVFLALLYLCSVLALLIWCLRWGAGQFAAGQGNGLTVLVLVVAGFALLGGVRGLLSRVETPGGKRLEPADAPEFFELLHSLRAEMRAGQVSKVWLDGEYGASVLQRPLFGLIGLTRCHLSLGLPLLAGFPREQLRAILAHELAHLQGGHGTWMRWIYRVREAWGRLGASGVVGWLLWPFERIMGPRFVAMTAVLSRHHEFEADARAAEVVGKDVMAAALIRTVAQGTEMETRHFPDFTRRSMASPEAPTDFILRATDHVRTIDLASERSRHFLRMEYGRRADDDDTHPTLFERLTALGLIRPETLPSEAIDRAHRLLLEHRGERDALEDLVRDPRAFLEAVDAEVHKALKSDWGGTHTTHLQFRERLGQLDEKVRTEITLVPEEGWERVTLVMALDGDAAARPLLETFVADHPDHGGACMAYALALYEEGNQRCLEWAERAASADPVQRAALVDLQQRMIRETSGETAAAAIDSDLFAQQDQMDLAAEERASLPPGTRFLPHDLTEPVVTRLVEQLQAIDRVGAAYLVKRVLEHLPERPQYIIAIHVTCPSWKLRDAEYDERTLAEVSENVIFPYDWVTVATTSLNRKLRRRIVGSEGALLFDNKKKR